MQEVFEKIIDRLEERASFLSDCTKYGNKDAEQQNKSYSTMMMYEVADLVDDLIEIVKQAAEEYEECYKHCGECEAYDKEKHHCPKFCKVIKETVKEIEENHNGWISCSERLPEEPEEGLTDLDECDEYIVMIEDADIPTALNYVGDGEWYRDGNYYKVIAWQPLPKPYTKGE